MTNNSTVLDKYQDVGHTPFDFVLENSEPKEFDQDLTPYPEYYVIGNTVFICQDTSLVIATSTYPQVKFHTRGLERIKRRQPSVIHRAKELRAIIGDPLDKLEHILQDIPVENDVWDEIAQEPYG